MTMDARARIIIEAVARQMVEEMKKAADAMKGLGDKTKEQAPVVQKTGQEWKAMLVQVGAATAAFYTVKKAIDFAREGAEVQELRGAFAGLAAEAGQSSDQIVAAIRRGADGTIAEMDAIAVATKTMNIGVASSPEEFEKLANVAEALGDRLGKDTVTSMNDVSAALALMMPRALRSAGITADAEGIWKAYAKSIGKTVEHLTMAEKRTAILNEANTRLGGGIASAADSFDAIGVALADFKTNLQETAATMADPYVTGLARLSQALTGVTDKTEKFPPLLDWTTRVAKSGGPVMYVLGQAFLGLSNAIADLKENLPGAIDNLRMILGIFKGADVPIEATEKATRRTHIEVRKLNESFAASPEAAARYKQAMEDASTANLDYLSSLASITSLNSQYEEQQGSLQEKIAGVKTEIQDLINKGWSPMSSKVKDLQDNLGELEDEYASNAEAFTARTNGIIFDMAREQLAMGGLSDAEAAILLEMGTNLGILDESAQTTYANWTSYIAAFLADPTIGSFTNWMDKYAVSRTAMIMITTAFRQGQPPPGVIPPTPKGGGTLKAETIQHGGPLPLGRHWALVGDPGPNQELISPWGYVFDAATTKEMLKSGMNPERKLATGGSVFIDGTTAAPKPTSAFLSKGPLPSWATPTTTSGGSGGASLATQQAVAEATVEAAAESITAEILPAITSAVIATQGGTQQAAVAIEQSAARTVAATEEVSALLRDLIALTAGQGGVKEFSVAIRDQVQQIVG